MSFVPIDCVSAVCMCVCACVGVWACVIGIIWRTSGIKGLYPATGDRPAIYKHMHTVYKHLPHSVRDIHLIGSNIPQYRQHPPVL